LSWPAILYLGISSSDILDSGNSLPHRFLSLPSSTTTTILTRPGIFLFFGITATASTKGSDAPSAI
jgi:hypothetical protein